MALSLGIAFAVDEHLCDQNSKNVQEIVVNFKLLK